MGVKPVGPGKFQADSMPEINERKQIWPGLPGKAGPDRSNGSPTEKVYASAQGIAGGTDTDAASDFPATSKDPQSFRPPIAGAGKLK